MNVAAYLMGVKPVLPAGTPRLVTFEDPEDTTCNPWGLDETKLGDQRKATIMRRVQKLGRVEIKDFSDMDMTENAIRYHLGRLVSSNLLIIHRGSAGRFGAAHAWSFPE